MLLIFLIFFIIILLLVSGGREFVDIDFPLFRHVKIKDCKPPHIHLPPLCDNLEPHFSDELPDFPTSVKDQVSFNILFEDFSYKYSLFGNEFGYYYTMIESIIQHDFREVILLGTYAGFVPLAVQEATGCKIHWFTIKPILKSVAKNRQIIYYERYPKEIDFKNLSGLPLFNFLIIYGRENDLEQKLNGRIYQLKYANYMINSFRPIFSRNILQSLISEFRNIILPEGKVLVPLYAYFIGGYWMLETSGSLRDHFYDIIDICKRSYVFASCQKMLNYDGMSYDDWRISKIPDYKKFMRVCNKFIGKMPEIFDKKITRNQALQKNACFKKEVAQNTGRYLFYMKTEKDFKYAFPDGIWQNMKKINFVPLKLSHEKHLPFALLHFTKRNVKINSEFSVAINIFTNFKKLFLLASYAVKKTYAYLIKSEEEFYLATVYHKKLKFQFYILSKLVKQFEVEAKRYYSEVKSEEEFKKLAKSRKEVVLTDNFYREEFIEPCALLLQHLWHDYPYPYRCFVYDSRLLQEILMLAFKDAIIFYVGEGDNHRQTLNVSDPREFLETGDFLFTRGVIVPF